MMEINSDYVIYTDERIRRGDGRRFQHYRKNGKYFDLKIVESHMSEPWDYLNGNTPI
ncbi:unnamed protein product [Hymenolepis diminuta]|uniref:Uncharacterized protein n=1 Tax=Hymenolepis diminuta TaxID=6216 RepID=A0A564XYL1_HYMDI|nr:unnamed protein product [Hymenolepis diminuta]